MSPVGVFCRFSFVPPGRLLPPSVLSSVARRANQGKPPSQAGRPAQFQPIRTSRKISAISRKSGGRAQGVCDLYTAYATAGRQNIRLSRVWPPRICWTFGDQTVSKHTGGPGFVMCRGLRANGRLKDRSCSQRRESMASRPWCIWPGLRPTRWLRSRISPKPIRFRKKFLDQILTELRHAGLVYSKKGKGGGYALARPADEI